MGCLVRGHWGGHWRAVGIFGAALVTLGVLFLAIDNGHRRLARTAYVRAYVNEEVQ